MPPMRFLTVLSLCLLGSILRAAISLDVDVQAMPMPQVTMSWNSQGSNTVEIARRPLGDSGIETWTVISADAVSPYTDTTVVSGYSYEYSVRSLTGGTSGNALAHFVATINSPLTDERGAVLLVVEETWAIELETELQLLELSLVADGWIVERLDWQREGASNGGELRAAIQDAVANNPAINSLFIFGAVEMVKSGWFAPDGHAARPHETDLFYADIDGVWTDTNTGGNYTAGDGIYDQTYYTSEIDLRTGRVTFHNMPAFKKGEVEYLRDYIHKDYAYRYRHREVTYQNYVGDDYFLYATNASLKPIVGKGNWSDVGHLNTIIRDESYLVAIGTRSGDWSPARDTFQKAIFTACFLSYIQNFWGENNNMRGMLAQPDWGLTAIWGARPAWYLHKIAAGLPIGQSIIDTQNDVIKTSYERITDPETGNNIYLQTRDYEFFSDSYDAAYVSNNLMGDPTLRVAQVGPVSNLTISRTDASHIQLNWTASPATDLIGYHVYASTDRLGSYSRLTDTPTTDISFEAVADEDVETWFQVRAVANVTVPTGVYEDQSHARFALAYGDGTVNSSPSATNQTVSGKINTPLHFNFDGSDADGNLLTPVVIDNPDNGQIRWYNGQPYYVSKRDEPGVDTATFIMFDGVTISEPATVTFITSELGDTLLAWEFPDGSTAAQMPTHSATHISSTAISGGPGTSIISAAPGTDAYTSRFIGSTIDENADYFEWTVTPESGYRMSITRMNFGICGDSGDDIYYELRASRDGFATFEVIAMDNGNIIGGGYGGNTGKLDSAVCSGVALLQNQDQPVNFRMHWWHTAGSSSSLGFGKITDPVYYDAIEDITVIGSITTDSGEPLIVTTTTDFTVEETGETTINVSLSAPPVSPVSLGVTHVSGDTDLSVSMGSTLNFDSTNWNIAQDVTFAAAYDSDLTSDSAVFEIIGAGLGVVSLTVTEIDTAQPPVATHDVYTITPGASLTVDAPGVLSNDTDPNDESLTAILEKDVSSGILEFNENGSFTYTPESGFEGTVSFTYKASDGALQSAETTVSFNVVTTTIKINVFGAVSAYTPEVYVLGQLTNGETRVLGSRWLEIVGNGWFMLDLGNVEITADTMLAFDFYSDSEAEIQGIGFDTETTTLNPEYAFQIWGSQAWAVQNLNDYDSSSPNVKHYEIAVGEHFTGTFRYLVIPQDDDVNESAFSTYGNIHIYKSDVKTDWAYAIGLDPLSNAGMGDDANSDGKPNFFHFGFNENPLGSGINEGKLAMSVDEENGDAHLTITAPFRLGAVFSGSPFQSAPIDGLVYTIYGDSDLSAPLGDLAVEEVTPALSTGLPVPDDLDYDVGPDWEYRSFRLINSVAPESPGFMWIGIQEAH